MKLIYLQHVAAEGLAEIEPWARAKGFEIQGVRLFDDEPLPPVDDVDLLIIMGGPMNIYQEAEHPWLLREKDFIRKAIDAGKPAIGICLGAQLLADVLGGPVSRGAHTEIGWFPCTLTEAGRKSPLFTDFPDTFEAFHWHGDTFAIPEGAELVASNEGCVNQAFVYDNRVVGLQFHIEESPETVDHLIDNFAHEMIPGPFVQSAEEIRARACACKQMNALLFTLLDRLWEPFA
jgi:GMP synthase (glutamine-hydrolysing)